MNKETYLIGKMAIEIDQLKTDKKLIADKMYELYDSNFVPHSLKWDCLRDTLTLETFKKKVKEIKEERENELD